MINMDISETSTKSEPLLIYEKMNTVHSGQGLCRVKVIHKTQHLCVHFKHDLSTGNTVHNVSKHLSQNMKTAIYEMVQSIHMDWLQQNGPFI
jgi:hypothetical protein